MSNSDGKRVIISFYSWKAGSSWQYYLRMTNAGALCEHLPYKNDSLTHPAEINK